MAEHSFYSVFELLFQDTEYVLDTQPTCFNTIYVNVPLPLEEQIGPYNTPPSPIKKHGIQPDCLIRNTRTNKTIYVELKKTRRMGGRENQDQQAGAMHTERLCK